MKLFFHTGSNLSISMAEINSFFWQYNIIKLSQDLVYLEKEMEDEEIAKLQKKMWWTIKISKLIWDFSQKEVQEKIIEKIIEAREKKEWKLRIWVNIFSKDIMLSKLMRETKKQVKSIRFVNNNFKNIDSVVTKKQILNKWWVEFTVIENREKNCFSLLKTISVQDVDSYWLRDYEKPARSAKVWMLPPKLAQILINLAWEKKSIWDPFVWTWTILMEWFLMWVNELYWSDISEEMLKMSKINTDWISQDFEEHWLAPIASEWELKIEIFEHNASEKNKIKADVIATEWYLWIPLEDCATQNFVDTNDKILAKIWEWALENFAENWIKKVVFCLPCYPDKKGKRFFCEKTLEIIKESKYNTLAQNLVYWRKGQFVHREIIVLEM